MQVLPWRPPRLAEEQGGLDEHMEKLIADAGQVKKDDPLKCCADCGKPQKKPEKPEKAKKDEKEENIPVEGVLCKHCRKLDLELANKMNACIKCGKPWMTQDKDKDGNKLPNTAEIDKQRSKFNPGMIHQRFEKMSDFKLTDGKILFCPIQVCAIPRFGMVQFLTVPTHCMHACYDVGRRLPENSLAAANLPSTEHYGIMGFDCHHDVCTRRTYIHACQVCMHG